MMNAFLDLRTNQLYTYTLLKENAYNQILTIHDPLEVYSLQKSVERESFESG